MGASLREEIRRLAREREAVILAHNYQPETVQELADYVGDSFGLSQQAAATTARIIVFCGVRFMAESASILASDKTVLLPVATAGCPLSDMITAQDVEALRAKHPGVPVVSYVNTSAEVKAASDYCCTSSNAGAVVASISAERVIFVPDRNLAAWVATKSRKEIISWKGFCPVHEHVTLRDLAVARERSPGASFICHPECPPEVVAEADHVTSTSGFFAFAARSGASAFIIGTEVGILPRLQREQPAKTFIPLSEGMVCPNMKLTRPEDVLRALTRNEHEVRVDAEIAGRARRALERMVSIAG